MDIEYQVDANGCDIALVSGEARRFGWKPPTTLTLRRRAVPPGLVLPRDQWGPWDLSNWAPAHYNQGNQNSCTGNGCAGWFGMIWAMSGRTPIRFSAGYPYAWINGGRDNGANMMDLLDEIEKHGDVPESIVDSHTIYRRNILPTADAMAQRFRLMEDYQPTTFDEIWSLGMRGIPTCFGCVLGGNFEPNDGGLAPDWDGSLRGGHCQYIVGGAFFNGRPYLKSRNSWGTTFALGGDWFMPESYFWRERTFPRYGQVINLEAFSGLMLADDPQATDDPEPIKP